MGSSVVGQFVGSSVVGAADGVFVGVSVVGFIEGESEVGERLGSNVG